MERFIGRQNVEHFRAMLKITTDPAQREVLKKLLLEAEAKLKTAEEDRKRNNASTTVIGANSRDRPNWGEEHDGEPIGRC